MDYRIQSPQAVANTSQQIGTTEKKGKQQVRDVFAPSVASGKKVAFRSGMDVVLHGSFKDFLAEQMAQQTGNGSSMKSTSSDCFKSASERTTERPAEIVHVLRKGETIWDLSRDRYKVDPQAVLNLNKITDPGKLQAGKEIRIPNGEENGTCLSEQVVAGWYGKYHHGRLMANGRPFNMHAATIAHRKMPIGTVVELENPKTGQKVKAEVTDRGPYHYGRDVDLSYGLAKQLSIAKQGVANLKMRVL